MDRNPRLLKAEFTFCFRGADGMNVRITSDSSGRMSCQAFWGRRKEHTFPSLFKAFLGFPILALKQKHWGSLWMLLSFQLPTTPTIFKQDSFARK